MSNQIPENQNPAVQTLFPGDDQPADPQVEFDALERGIDDFPEDSDLIVVSAERPPLGKSWRFSFVQGGFGTAGAGPIPTAGAETLKGWVDKVMHTEQGAHPIHPPEYGVVAPFSLLGTQFNSHEQSSYEERVRNAILFHPRVADVRDFATDYDPDDEVLNVQMTVVMDDGSAVPIGVSIP